MKILVSASTVDDFGPKTMNFYKVDRSFQSGVGSGHGHVFVVVVGPKAPHHNLLTENGEFG